MKKRLWIYFAYVAVLVILPILVARPWQNGKKEESALPQKVTVLFPETGEEQTMELEEYVKGVVAAEMPASFETEALKAQAVAARTYTVSHMKDGAHPGHSAANTCTDPTHCKAYKSEEEAKASWGKEGKAYWEKISSAVEATEGEIAVYQGEPIDAVFHSASAGHTADAKDVWSASVPYLKSVESRGEEASPDYRSTVTVPFSSFREKILSAHPDLALSSPSDIGAAEVGDGGYVKWVTIGGEAIKGGELRSLFSLRSTAFSITADGENVVFSVTGHGHGVGMSQYGANAMAKEGASYQEILANYYTGTTVEKR